MKGAILLAMAGRRAKVWGVVWRVRKGLLTANPETASVRKRALKKRKNLSTTKRRRYDEPRRPTKESGLLERGLKTHYKDESRPMCLAGAGVCLEEVNKGCYR